MANEKKKVDRKPTEYVVLAMADRESADGAVTFYPLFDDDTELEANNPTVFEGFRKQDVLQDLVDGGRLPTTEDGKTVPALIIPASQYDLLRGVIEVRKRVTVERT